MVSLLGSVVGLAVGIPRGAVGSCRTNRAVTMGFTPTFAQPSHSGVGLAVPCARVRDLATLLAARQLLSASLLATRELPRLGAVRGVRVGDFPDGSSLRVALGRERGPRAGGPRRSSRWRW
jgi:hypothetical protein